MGNSSSTTNLIKNETNMKMTQNFTTNNITETSASSTNTQTIRLKFGYADGCPVDAEQSIISKVTVKAKLDNQAVIEFKNSLEASVQETLKQNASMVSGFAAATGGNETEAMNDVQNIVNEVIDQSVTTNNIQKVCASSFNSQSGELTMDYCKNSPIKFKQTIVSEIIAENILNNVQNALMENSTIAGIVAHVDQTSSQENKGLNDLVDSMGKALTSMIGAVTGPLAGMYIGALCLLAVCCIALLYFFLSPAGQNSAKIVAQAGANVGKTYASGGLK